MTVILVHGSVETSCRQHYLSALAEAAYRGYHARHGGVLDVVERAVMALEDDPLFNAGLGSVLNDDGEVEMDAAIMDGPTGRCGAVAAIRSVKNPVCVARKVMEETPHVLLAGEGAVAFARRNGFGPFDPVIALQRAAWEQARAARARGEECSFSAFTGLPVACDTVGCVAVLEGRPAAASSTGGSFLKLPGRVGDTPVIGAGIYATPFGAAVCTGLGEACIELFTAAWTLNLIAQGVGAVEAARAAIRRITCRGATAGILAVTAAGEVAAVHNASSFPVILLRDGRVIEDFTPVRVGSGM